MGAQTRTDVVPYNIYLILVFGYLWPGTSIYRADGGVCCWGNWIWYLGGWFQVRFEASW